MRIIVCEPKQNPMNWKIEEAQQKFYEVIDAAVAEPQLIYNQDKVVASNLDRVLDAAMQLPLKQQEMLVQILVNRIIESRRDEIASDAAVSIAEFQAGRLKVQTATEAIQELREYLNNPSASHN